MSAAAAASRLPADPWPRVVNLSNGQVLVYQPQVNTWTDNRLDFRAALAIKPTGAKEETFGVVFATARTQVDKVLRTVTFEDLKISKIDFPTLPEPRRGLRAGTARRSSPSRCARSHSTGSSPRSRSPAIKPPSVRGAEHAAAGPRQLLAGDPGADRRRAGAEAGAGPSARRSG